MRLVPKPRSPKAKIFVVDDEAHGRLALQELLDGGDREVVVASSGAEALQRVSNSEFALILLDVRMPGMDGFETARLIRGQRRSARTPIIFLTGAYEDMASVMRGYAAGAVDYVVKPVEPEVLRSKVAVFIDLYRKSAQLAMQILERRKAERALSRANEQLESRIQERTQSLTAANELLRREIAMRRRMEDELRQAKQAAESANVAKTEFLANMSHEIRTPMNAIVGMTELALQAELTPEVREYLGVVKASSDSMLGIVNDILDLSKIEAGRLAMEAIPFSLRECVGDAIRTLALQAHDKQLELVCDIDRRIPDVLVGDPLRLRQIVINLVSNGIKFTERGEVVLAAAPESRTAAEVRCHFSIRDTGIGIPKDRRRAIFKRFLQADSATTRLYGGTGLGLTIASRLVEMMHGRIRLESEPEKGSTFHFTARFGVGTTVHGSTADASLGGRRVLIVDDHPVSRQTLSAMVSGLHAEAKAVEGAAAAARLAKKFQRAGTPFSIVLLDDTLPGIDSYALARQLAMGQEFGAPKVILFGFVPRREEIESSPGGVAITWLAKPLKHSELLEALCGLIGVPRPARTIAETAAHRPPGEKLCILLAEDNPLSQKLAQHVLRKQGHDVVLADDGYAALRACERQEFDLILMDVRMPRMNGLQATATIRARERHSGRRTPIVALTANAMVGDRESCMQAGMDDCLIKPIQPSSLIEAVSRLRRAGGASRDKEAARPILDRVALLERIDGDMALLGDMTAAYFRDCNRLLSRARGAVARRDVSMFRHAVHTLCGMFRNLSAQRAQDAAVRLHQIDLVRDPPATAAALSALEDEVKLLSGALSSLAPAVPLARESRHRRDRLGARTG